MAVHPYQGAYGLKRKTYNGALTDDQAEARVAEWVDWVNKAHPLTMDIFKAMDDVQRKQYRSLTVWGPAGGLRVQSRGAPYRKWRSIVADWKVIAKLQARQARFDANWTDRDPDAEFDEGEGTFLVAPNGKTHSPNGQGFGSYTMPSDEYDRGAWDGILKPGDVFTV